MEISTLDRLILDVAKEEVPKPRRIAVFDDPSGDLLGSVLESSSVEVIYFGSRTIDQARRALEVAERAGAQLDAGAHEAASIQTEGTPGGRGGKIVHVAGFESPLRLEEFLAKPIDLAIGRVPKSLEETAYIAAAVAGAGGILVIGANNKHMDRGHNATLANYFTDVRASLGRGKFRTLIGGGEAIGRTYSPAVGGAEYGPIFGVGGVFSGADEDAGGKFLLDHALNDMKAENIAHKAALDPWSSWERPSEGRRTDNLDVVDLGCGNGAVVLAVLDALPEARVLATDTHADAIVSASLTLGEFVEGGRARITWDDAAGEEEEASADVVLLNPPFHDGTAIDATLVQGLLDASRRLLRPSGRLYMVHNNHLRYRSEVEARFEQVQQLARNPKFTVLRASTPR